MLSLLIQVADIDYSDISSKVIPLLLENQSRKEDSGKIVKVLTRFKGLYGAAAGAALKVLPQNVKDDAFIQLIRSFEVKILEAVNKLLADNNLTLKLKEITVNKTDRIEITLILDDIDYNTLITNVNPLIRNKLGASLRRYLA